MVVLGEKIKTLRVSRNMTQSELAKRLNVTKSTVSSYENDSRQPSYEVLIKISSLFNVTIDSLLIGERNGIYLDMHNLNQRQIKVILDLLNVFMLDNISQPMINDKNNEEVIIDEIEEP